MNNLHEHHAEMTINPSHDLVALCFRHRIAIGMLQVVQPDLPVPLVCVVQHPAQKSGQLIRLLDREHLRKGDQRANDEIHEIIKPRAANLIAHGGILRSGLRCHVTRQAAK